MNRLALTAQIVERGAVRYTPAGLPALDVRLAHDSQVVQDGAPRRVFLEIHALAIGDEMVRRLGSLAVGATADFSGFLARQRNGRGVMLHINGIDTPARESAA